MPAEHDRFLRRARTRWVQWRVVESAGICAGIGAGIGFLLLPLLLWRSEPAVGPAVGLLVAGAVAGSIWALMQIPTIKQTAMMVDRQLELHDLLSTVISSQTWGDRGFAEVVAMQAGEVCRRISPNELIVRRLGGRAWGGIGIASALLVTVAMMSTQPISSEARVQPAQAIAPNEAKVANDVSSRAQISELNPSSARRETASGKDDATADQGTDREGEQTGGSRQSLNVTQNDGTGAAAGRSDDGIPEFRPSASRSDGYVSTQDSASSGSGRSDGARDGSGYSISGIQSQSTVRPAPPWRSSSWTADRAAANEDLREGRTPDAYRDLVRDYFDRE